jgi:hypothetical protein
MSSTTHGLREPQFLMAQQHRQQQFITNRSPLSAAYTITAKGDNPWA